MINPKPPPLSALCGELTISSNLWRAETCKSENLETVVCLHLESTAQAARVRLEKGARGGEARVSHPSIVLLNPPLTRLTCKKDVERTSPTGEIDCYSALTSIMCSIQCESMRSGSHWSASLLEHCTQAVRWVRPDEVCFVVCAVRLISRHRVPRC